MFLSILILRQKKTVLSFVLFGLPFPDGMPRNTPDLKKIYKMAFEAILSDPCIDCTRKKHVKTCIVSKIIDHVPTSILFDFLP